MKNKKRNIIPLIILLFSFSFGFSQSLITVKTKNFPKEITPGKHYTFLIEISNQTNKDLHLSIEYNLPPDLTLLLAKNDLKLTASRRKNIICTFSVSKYCKSGISNISINVFNNDMLLNKLELKPTIEKVHNLTIEPISNPDYLRFEKEFLCEYLITNNGNSEERIDLTSTNSVEVIPSEISLKPDSVAVVKVTQNVPFSPYAKTSVLSLLKAQLRSNGKEFSNRISIPVYPNGTKKPDVYHRFPISVSSTFNSVKGIDTISAMKFKVEGIGYLDRNNEHYLNFLLSGPNQIEMNRFGEYDQYKLHYKSKKIELKAGDISYSLSNLTEMSRYGFGSILTYRLKKSEATIFYINPRFTSKISGTYGGDFKWYFANKAHIKLAFLDRTLNEDNTRFKSQIYSLSSGYNGKFFKLNGEIAYENNPFTNGFGYSVESYISSDRFYWGNSAQYSDKNFKGYLRDSKQFLSHLNYQISNGIRINMNGNYRSINPEKDEINYNSSPRITYLQGSLNLKLNRKNRLRIGGSFRKKEDRFQPKKFDFEEQLVRLNYSFYKMNGFNINFLNSYGTSKNFLAVNNPSKNVFFSSLDISFSLLKNLTAGISGNFEQTNKNSIDNELQNSFYYGGHLQYQIRNSLNLNLFYRNDYAEDEIEADVQSYIEAQLDLNLNRNHQFSFSASQSTIPSFESSLEKELFLSATYRFIINAPLSKDKTKGTLKGYILSDDENENLEGILVSLENHATVTNKKGEFIFYNLKPNEYNLDIVESSIPKGKKIVHSFPLKIDVLPNKESAIELKLSKTGKLTGQINFENSTTVQSSKFNKKLPPIVVKIYNENQKYLTQTNKTGKFNFTKLTPGEWTIELLVKNLTKDFSFEKIKETVTIKQNQNTKISFKVTPRKRTIKKSKKTFKL